MRINTAVLLSKMHFGLCDFHVNVVCVCMYTRASMEYMNEFEKHSRIQGTRYEGTGAERHIKTRPST